MSLTRWSIPDVEECSDPTAQDSIGLSALDFAVILGDSAVVQTVVNKCNAFFESSDFLSAHSSHSPNQGGQQQLQVSATSNFKRLTMVRYKLIFASLQEILVKSIISN